MLPVDPGAKNQANVLRNLTKTQRGRQPHGRAVARGS